MAASSSSAPPTKKQRVELAAIIAKSGLPIAPQAAGLGLTTHVGRMEIHKHDKAQTPFGPLYIELVISPDLKVTCLNPFGFLWMAASQSECASAFFKEHLGCAKNRIAFYCDGVTPGNVLRPDSGRSFEAIYWTFLELPRWYRCNASASWFPLTFVDAKQLKSVKGGMAAVAKAVVDLFFSASLDAFNFERTGMLIGDVHVTASFGCWLADEKAIKEVVSCKGSSGHKPCISCKNVVTRMEGDDEYLVHFSCHDAEKFDAHTAESVAFMATDLAAKSGVVSKAEFDFFEKAYGLVYEPSAILFDEHCRRVVQFPSTIYWDWMHCTFASGGVAQYQVNALAMCVCSTGLDLAALDAFVATVSIGSGRSKLSKTFFSDRIVSRPDAHMKAFASEMLTAIQVLGIFADVVLKPMGALGPHLQCFDMLREIANTLVLGDVVATMMPRMREVTKAHHELFATLYPGCVKPKMHYLKHAVECIGRFGKNLSCFGPERRHKDAKAIANVSYHNVCKSMLVRLTHSFFLDMADQSTFKRCKLGPQVKLPDWSREMVRQIGGVSAEVSHEIRIRDCGTLKVGDVVWLANPVRLAKLKLAVHDEPMLGHERFCVIVDVFNKHTSGVWASTVAGTIAVSPDDVTTLCCYIVVGDNIFV